MSSIEIKVRVLKYDGTLHREWRASLRHRDDSLIVLDAAFDVDVSHELMGEIPSGTRTIEYYWLDRWYCIFQFLNSDGSTRLYYGNINIPPELDGERLTYVDLDIDVLVQPDFSYQVLDLKEFAENAERYGYSEAEKTAANAAVGELVTLIEKRQFPFLIEPSPVSSLVK